jgi:hypothetical protein
VLCVAGRSPLDEAAAAMLAQLLGKYGLGARVESADAVATMNILRLETSGVAMVCLSYLDASSPAHMRYTIRRMHRRLPAAQVLLACWKADLDPATLRDSTKADAVATALPEAVRLCLEAVRNSSFERICSNPSRRAQPQPKFRRSPPRNVASSTVRRCAGSLQPPCPQSEGAARRVTAGAGEEQATAMIPVRAACRCGWSGHTDMRFDGLALLASKTPSCWRMTAARATLGIICR